MHFPKAQAIPEPATSSPQKLDFSVSGGCRTPEWHPVRGEAVTNVLPPMIDFCRYISGLLCHSNITGCSV